MMAGVIRLVVAIGVLASTLALSACTGITSKAFIPASVSGVKITVQSTPGSAAGGNIQLAPASKADRPAVSPASIIAKCKQPKACFGQSRPTDMTLAHVTNTLSQLRDRLAWLVTWEFP